MEWHTFNFDLSNEWLQNGNEINHDKRIKSVKNDVKMVLFGIYLNFGDSSGCLGNQFWAEVAFDR